jgi:hypothetical protein
MSASRCRRREPGLTLRAGGFAGTVRRAGAETTGRSAKWIVHLVV